MCARLAGLGFCAAATCKEFTVCGTTEAWLESLRPKSASSSGVPAASGWLAPCGKEGLIAIQKREDGPKTNKLPDMDWAGQECVERKRQKLKHIVDASSF